MRGGRKKAELEFWSRTDPAQKAGCEHTYYLPCLGARQLHDMLLSYWLEFHPLFKHISKFTFLELFLIDSHFILIVQFCIVTI